MEGTGSAYTVACPAVSSRISGASDSGGSSINTPMKLTAIADMADIVWTWTPPYVSVIPVTSNRRFTSISHGDGP